MGIKVTHQRDSFTATSLAGLLVVLSLCAHVQAAQAQSSYRVFVAAGTDSIHVVSFDGAANARLEHSFEVGARPDTAEGVHGLALAPDGKVLFATVGNGRVDGRLLRFEAATGRGAGAGELGPGVSGIVLSADGALVYLTMSDASKSMARGSVWVVGSADLKPVASLTTCIHPVGGRLTRAGRHYSVCAMEDLVIELDMEARRVNRRFSVVEDEEQAVDTTAAPPDGPFTEGRVLPPSCSPGAAEPSPDGKHVWVACNRNSSVLEIEVASWTLERKISTGHGPNSLALTPDGKTLLVVLRQGRALQLFDAAQGSLKSRVELSPTPHSIEVSADGRFAFISCEGENGAAGTLDIVDIRNARRIASVALGGKAGALTVQSPPR
jgi:DNA-binding beta-propeller fold protein YncE